MSSPSPAFKLADRNIQGLEQLLDYGKLCVQSGIHGRTLSLVLRQHINANLWLALIKGTNDTIWREGLNKLDKHIEEAKQRASWRTIGAAIG